MYKWHFGCSYMKKLMFVYNVASEFILTNVIKFRKEDYFA